MRKTRLRILVLCTGNSCRSQIAEGFFRSLGDKKVEIFSAGLTPHGLNPLAVKTMAEIGIDISTQTSDSLEKYLELSFDYLITVCDNAADNCPVFPGQAKGLVRLGQAVRLHWPFEDPAGTIGTESERMVVFAKVRDDIGEQIRQFLSKLE